MGKPSTRMRHAQERNVAAGGFAVAIACIFSNAHSSSVEEQRQENLRRLLQAKSGTALAAPKAPSSSYTLQLALAVKRHIHLTAEIEGDPEAVVRIETALDGRIVSQSLVRSSGVVEWDRAVLDAVIRTERLPLEASETLPKFIEFHFRPK